MNTLRILAAAMLLLAAAPLAMPTAAAAPDCPYADNAVECVVHTLCDPTYCDFWICYDLGCDEIWP